MLTMIPPKKPQRSKHLNQRLAAAARAYRGPRQDLDGNAKLNAAWAWWEALPQEARDQLQPEFDLVQARLKGAGNMSTADFFLALHSLFLYLDEERDRHKGGDPWKV